MLSKQAWIILREPGKLRNAAIAAKLVGITAAIVAGVTAFSAGRSQPPVHVTSAPHLIVSPIAGLKGSTVPVVLTGSGFNGTTTVTITGTAVTIGAVSVSNPSTVLASLTIAADATSGSRDLILTTGSNQQTAEFWVPFSNVSNNSIYAPPYYGQLLPPAVRDSYVDAIFGSTITRMSDAATTPDDAAGSGFLPSISTEYSTMSPFNNDNSLILGLHFSYFGLYNRFGHFVKNLPFAVNASSEPRWSRVNPNVLYFVSGNELRQFDVATNVMTTVHTFTQYTSISGKGESDISFDGNHFALTGSDASGKHIFVYQISSDSLSPAFAAANHAFDSTHITPNNNVLVVWQETGAARFNGVELFDPNMNFLRQLTTSGGHLDVTRDSGGAEVMLWANAAEVSVSCPNGVVKVRLSDGVQTCLLSLDPNLAFHVSCPDDGGWCFLSTYTPTDPDPTSVSWTAYTNEVLQMKLDGTVVLRLAHHRSRAPYLTAYEYQPRAAVSRDGSRLVFTSNFGLPALLGYSDIYSDIYLLVRPPEKRPRSQITTPEN